MSNLLDYVKWRGDLSLDERPLDILDQLVLCELSYLDLDPVEESIGVSGRTLQACYEEIRKQNRYDLLTTDGGHQDFVEACAASRRFGTLVLDHYVHETDPELNIQFAALCFRLGVDLDYIAYRGTDRTIVGWKEDFMMSFTTVPSQTKAVQYLQETMQAGRKAWVGGHSKGGNLAVYACALNPDLQERIAGIGFFDGPGFCTDLMDLSLLEPIRERIIRIVPAYDIIGQIFAFDVPDTRIVRSDARGILQHDLMSWQLDGPQLVLEKDYAESGRVASGILSQWVARLSPEDRTAFVNEYFDAFAANGAVSFDEIRGRDYGRLLSEMLSVSPEARDSALLLPKTAVEELFRQAGDLFSAVRTLPQAQVRELFERYRNRTEKE